MEKKIMTHREMAIMVFLLVLIMGLLTVAAIFVINLFELNASPESALIEKRNLDSCTCFGQEGTYNFNSTTIWRERGISGIRQFEE